MSWTHTVFAAWSCFVGVGNLRNEMVARVCLALLILSSLKIPWVLEQPQSSILELSQPFQNLAKRFKVWKVGFRMFQFLEVSHGCLLLD